MLYNSDFNKTTDFRKEACNSMRKKTRTMAISPYFTLMMKITNIINMYLYIEVLLNLNTIRLFRHEFSVITTRIIS